MTSITSLRSAAILFAGAITLAGCASTAGDYPSLAIRDVERVSGEMPAPADPEPLPAPTAPAASLLDQLASLRAEAASAQRTFAAARPRAERSVAAGGRASTGSDAWAEAQVALADLIAIRSRTAVPLGTLDALFVDAEVEGYSASRELAAISEVRAEAIALVSAQDRTIARLAARIR
ncbi:hypothetical protein HME9302_01625 [Alteripontixanthobacter maritimus]|uniref:DUF4142 domain-containing protein n=1 Tax=Alteripontixanthobacter maritimus TaxID=2161824 RepID=A0A369QDQ6_9SPHN|nr:hypothetical protein [Alteripontixanthobacter maritimus]RDC60418.1 hypothetical protein HME9302_01625 [Alteripontixanthobacter maritimus]